MGFERIHVVGAAACALVSWMLVTAAVPSLRWIPHAFSAGFLVALLLTAFLFASSSQTNGPRIVPRPIPAFITTSNWEARKADVLLRSQYVHRKLFESKLQLSSRFDGILDLILKTFVTAWYTNISTKPLFQNEVDNAIRDAIISIQSRVQELDLIEIAVSRIVPIITGHMQEFYTAERLVRGKNLTRDVTESEELDLAIASKYNDGKLHSAASLAFADTRLMQQAHVRKGIEKILPLVMSEEMLSSPAVLALVREIVSCAVLAPILLMLSDPDMWNQIIENYGKSILQDRKNVRKLRAALDEHASTPRGSKSAEAPRLRPFDSERQFERFIRNLRKTPNLAVARRYRSEISSQIRKASLNPNGDALFARRLEAGRKILDQRIAALTSIDETIRRPSFPTQMSASGTDANGHSSGVRLKDVLQNASGLSYFMEFMDRRQRMRLVQFWIIVEGFRAPLEGDAEEADITLHEKMTFESPDRMNIKQLRDAYLNLPELHVPEASKAAVDMYVNAGKSADLTQYVKARRAILRAQAATYEEMREDHLEPFKRSDLFYKWSTSESQTQSPVVEQGDTWQQLPRSPRTDKPPSQRPVSGSVAVMRKQPELRRAVMSATDLQSRPKQLQQSDFGRRSIDDNASRPLFDDDVEDERMTQSVPSLAAAESDNESFDQGQYSAQVVDAMQKELTEIIDEPEKDRHGTDSPVIDSNESPGIGDDLFRSPTESSVRPSIASLGLVTGSSRGVFTDDLFGHEEERYLEDEKEDPELRPIEDDIHEAAPGDLGLTEAISVLTNDIERLVAQEKIVESLTKKAELTNNAAELRILRKSTQSLQREMRRKEMQKQQYVVQESDNSLYGRAAVSIKSIMVGKEEDGHEFAIYVIEVRRQAGDAMPAATWTITRRYSEFHDLHKRLRARFDSVRNLEFPRRQTLFTLQKDFLQRRRIVLERYLRSLLLIPAICRSRELRAFLSQSAIASSTDTKLDSGDLVSRIYSSVSDGMEEFLGNLPMLDQLTVAGQNLISAASAQITGSTPTPSSPAPTASGPRDAEAEAEIAAFESAESLAAPFVKPISDLFLELFELQKGAAWLRGRAVVVVLHQLLGGTVERKIRDAARAATDEAALVRHLDAFREIMWPAGTLKPAGAPRSVAAKAASRAEAARVLEGLVPDMAGSVVGRQNARQAGRKVAAMVGNQRLNTHLVMRLWDEIIGVAFPEIK